MKEHTPGPWKVMPRINNFIDIEHANFVKGAITLSLCRVQARQSWSAEAHANALLIAAAPDLLEALKELISAYDFQMSSYEQGSVSIAAHAAIFKATGVVNV